ncbi:uncharacterized protein LOC135839171 isoform X1 [Planococcus citri]|uniref:uncharacterized protein LOC135839171 isoform X1 n=2 Tax=Planococcus citri TaxID=170843 RepID=UPI0031F7F4D7
MNIHKFITWNGNQYSFKKPETSSFLRQREFDRARFKEGLWENTFDSLCNTFYMDDIRVYEPNFSRLDFPTDFIQSISIEDSSDNSSDTDSFLSSRPMERYRVPVCQYCGEEFEAGQETVRNETCPHTYHRECVKSLTEQRTPAGNFRYLPAKCQHRSCGAVLIRQHYHSIIFRYETPENICTNSGHRHRIANLSDTIDFQRERINALNDSLRDAVAQNEIMTGRIADLEREITRLRRPAQDYQDFEDDLNHRDNDDDDIGDAQRQMINHGNQVAGNENIHAAENQEDRAPDNYANNDNEANDRQDVDERNDLNEPIDRAFAEGFVQTNEEREMQRRMDQERDAQDGVIPEPVPASVSAPAPSAPNLDDVNLEEPHPSNSEPVLVAPELGEAGNVAGPSRFREPFRPSTRNVFSSFYNSSNVLVNHVMRNATEQRNDHQHRDQPLLDDEDAPYEDFRTRREIRVYDGGVQSAVFPHRRGNIMAILNQSGYTFNPQIQRELRHEYTLHSQQMYSSVYTSWSPDDRRPTTHIFLNGWWVIGDGLAHGVAREPLRRDPTLKSRWDRSRFAGSFLSAKRLRHNIQQHAHNIPRFCVVAMGGHDLTLESEHTARINTSALIQFLLDQRVERILILPIIIADRRPDAEIRRSYRDWQRGILPQLDRSRVTYLQFLEETVDRVQPYHADLAGIIYAHPFVHFDIIYRLAHMLRYFD